MSRLDDMTDAAETLAAWSGVSFIVAFDSVQCSLSTGVIPAEWRRLGPVGKTVAWQVAFIRLRISLGALLRYDY